jgi:hypothetical protein
VTEHCSCEQCKEEHRESLAWAPFNSRLPFMWMPYVEEPSICGALTNTRTLEDYIRRQGA